MNHTGAPSVIDAAMGAMDGQSVNNVIALCAALIAFLSVGVAIFVYWRTEQRERRIEKSTAYLDLEVNSSEAFRYQAVHGKLMKPLREWERPPEVPDSDSEAWETTLNYYFQCLNLFEVCANFRRNRIIQPQVFASWVAWLYDILKDWYFREIWDTELRANYTRDVRNIFDVGKGIFERYPDNDDREREFYAAVAHLMGGCRSVATWLDEIRSEPAWPPKRRHALPFLRRIDYQPREMTDRAAPTPDPSAAKPPATALDLTWNKAADTAEAAVFAARVIRLSDAYISHGEIQTGLSPDGKSWSPDLAEMYASDFADREDRDLLVARDGDGAIAGIAIVAWEETPRRRFAVLEDMAVDPDRRSGGVGAQLLEAVADRVSGRGVEWLFLESGLRNHRAHAFFERHGFDEISHVFARRLTPA